MNLFQKIKHHVVRTPENKGTPHFLRSEIMMFFLVLVLLMQVISFSGVLNLILKSAPQMFASVLPSILALETNQYRNTNNVSSLLTSPLLSRAAELKAKDMAERGYFSHVSPDGEKPWVWFEKVGYSYTYAGENLAVNFTDSEDVTSAWIKSETHRENIINQHFTETGIGTAEGIYENKPTVFVVQFFGTPAEVVSAPTPVKKVTHSKTTKVKVATVATSSGSVLGLYTNTVPSDLPAYAPILTSPRHVMNNIILGVILFFILILLISGIHTAKNHDSEGLITKSLHSLSAHKKLIYKVIFFLLLMCIIWSLDYYVFSKHVSVEGGNSNSIGI
jgi:Cysteine-rich secretory protein family